jgi:predicted dehydrogenase
LGGFVGPSRGDAEAGLPSESNRKYRAGVIGLGWMGLLYDLGKRPQDRFQTDDVHRPTPTLDVHRKFHHHEHPGDEGLPSSYSEAFWDRPEVELVAGAERDTSRLKVFGERYGIKALYSDAIEMMRKEKLDIVAVCTNTKGRAFLTIQAAELGAKGILTEKPMCHTLDEADKMVKACTDRGIPLCCGAITTTHPSFAKARELVRSGTIGEIISIEASGPSAQHQNWSYFLDSPPAWVAGSGDKPRRESGSDEFAGEGIMVTRAGQMVHFRKGAPGVRLSGSKGEISFDYAATGTSWRLWQNVETGSSSKRVEMPWPSPQFLFPYGAVYCLADVLDCLDNKLDEPKNSGRRVATALEVEIALKQSSIMGGAKVDLPLADRSLGLHYDWFR